MTEFLIDAHCHSLRSDGLLSLQQLAQLARLSGLSALAITDHDALPDPRELKSAGEPFAVEMHAGVELSVRLGDRSLHLLGYRFDPADQRLQSLCRELQELRRRRFHRMAEALRAGGVKLDAARVDRLASGISPGRMHLARELVRCRAASHIRAAFARHLSTFDSADAAQDGTPLALADALDALHDAGGVGMLAHPPARMTVGEWRRLAEIGLDGIESDFPGAAATHRRFLSDRVREYHWLETKGSDYHGDNPQRHLGAKRLTESEWRTILDKGIPYSLGNPHGNR
ncbi:MAG TPA: PHP domain-containing protein [Planctomycetia bacterium]|nr:PHP domain-containing protein [Planctomycetia bacterium]